MLKIDRESRWSVAEQVFRALRAEIFSGVYPVGAKVPSLRALLAFAAEGVRLPEDVRLVTLSLRGLGPVWTRPLTRYEVDPLDEGRRIARYVLGRIAGTVARTSEIILPTRFCLGETL